jgi:hypothetical protein
LPPPLSLHHLPATDTKPPKISQSSISLPDDGQPLETSEEIYIQTLYESAMSEIDKVLSEVEGIENSLEVTNLEFQFQKMQIFDK